MEKVSTETEGRSELTTKSRLEQLEKLISLRDSGDITQAEFEAQKSVSHKPSFRGVGEGVSG